jgi:hypothetical protein
MFIIVGLMWAIVGFNMLVVVYFGWLGDSNKKPKKIMKCQRIS